MKMLGRIEPDTRVEARYCWREGEFQGWVVSHNQMWLGPYTSKEEADAIELKLKRGEPVFASVRADKWAPIKDDKHR